MAQRQAARCLGSVLRGFPGLAQVQASSQAIAIRGFADDSNLKKTVLNDYHIAAGGKMVPFAGWSMPIQYKDSIMDSTKHCREGASIFDVSHMCGLTLTGKDCVSWLEGLVVGDIASLKDGTGTLSVLTNERGGIIDDTVITKVSDTEIYAVVNAGCREKDVAHFEKHLASAHAAGKEVHMHLHDERCLLALQGPKAASVLQPLAGSVDLDKLYFGMFSKFDLAGVPCFVTRTGYTGEDGFEISIPHDGTLKITELLMENEAVRLAGLGARDSLRLEAGLCLYGNDLNEDISPIEAGLTWCIGKRRREACDFVGGDVIKQQLADGVSRRRVGLITKGPPARGGCSLVTAEGETVGETTSGCFSPCLGVNISMGYMSKPQAKAGTELKVLVRNKENRAVVTKMPFVPAKYHRPS